MAVPACAERRHLQTGCCPLQAALKVIAEMQRIPMPSPRKAGAPQPESSAASEDDAAGGDNSSTGSQQQENVHQAFVGASYDLRILLYCHCHICWSATQVM